MHLHSSTWRMVLHSMLKAAARHGVLLTLALLAHQTFTNTDMCDDDAHPYTVHKLSFVHQAKRLQAATASSSSQLFTQHLGKSKLKY